jgi:cell division cycle 20-like protein 1 (cofactor of APC complex)
VNPLIIIISTSGKSSDENPVKMGAAEDASNTALVNAHISKSNNALNTAPVNTPPRAMTPPPATEKRRIERSTTVDSGARSERSKTMEAAVDPNALSKALMREFGDSGRSSDITPGGSPSRKRQRIYGDR